MQLKEVRAFRQRLVRGGFTDISIYNNFNSTYTVYCTSPHNEKIWVVLSIIQMNAIPRLVWFGDR